MWQWCWQLKELGFSKKSDRYWQCGSGYGLDVGQYISLFLWTSDRRRNATLFELSEFHVTIQLSGHNLHFYFHEVDLNRWKRGGHTSSHEIRLLGYCPAELVAIGDSVAETFVDILGGELI